MEKDSSLSQPLRASRDYGESIPDYDSYGKEKTDEGKKKESCDCSEDCKKKCSCD